MRSDKRMLFHFKEKERPFFFFNVKKTLITAYQQHSDQVIHCERLPRGMMHRLRR